MPLYEYRCTACGHRFELLQSSASSPHPACPACRQPTEKMLTAPGGFQMKEAKPPQGRCCGSPEQCGQQRHCCEH